MRRFGEVYTTYYKSSFLFVKSFIRDDMISEDIASESLITLWETMRKEPVEYPKALLLRILKNNALNYLKHISIKDGVIENMTSIYERDLSLRIATLQACEPEEIYTNEIAEIVENVLNGISSQSRMIFEMSRYKQYSVKEIATALDLNVKSVEYHLTKTLKLLRLALKPYLPILSLLYFQI